MQKATARTMLYDIAGKRRRTGAVKKEKPVELKDRRLYDPERDAKYMSPVVFYKGMHWA